MSATGRLSNWLFRWYLNRILDRGSVAQIERAGRALVKTAESGSTPADLLVLGRMMAHQANAIIASRPLRQR